jgi:hypothetical protein
LHSSDGEEHQYRDQHALADEERLDERHAVVATLCSGILNHADDPRTDLIPVLADGSLLTVEPNKDDGEVDDVDENDGDDEQTAPLQPEDFLQTLIDGTRC